MSLRVLSDGNVRTLLAGLDAAALDGLFAALGAAFQAYSVGDEKQYQCHRQGVTRPGGPTMLFMPATLSDGVSVKVVGVPPPTPASAPASASVSTPLSDPVSAPISATPSPKGLTGVVLVCDQDGRAVGLLNAAALTAFRTALGSILLYRHRAATSRIVVFGAGKQALWHIRLALVLRRADITAVTIVNRSAARAEGLVAELRAMTDGAGDSSGGAKELSHITFAVLSPGSADAVREAVQQADVIFCTTPSTTPLFPAAWLTAPGEQTASRESRFIAAIGSYRLDMQELDPDLLRTAATDATFPGSYLLPGSASSGSTIIVDSRDACAVEAGELVKAAIPDSHLVETGELLHLRGTLGAQEEQRLAAWLREGNVIYKSVGIGIMDLSIGRALLELGETRGVGTTIAQF